MTVRLLQAQVAVVYHRARVLYHRARRAYYERELRRLER